MRRLTNPKRIGNKCRGIPKRINEEQNEEDDQSDTNFTNNLTKRKQILEDNRIQQEQEEQEEQEQLNQDVDMEIKQIFKSFFRTQTINPKIVLTAKQLLLEQMTRLISRVVQIHVRKKNKSNFVHLNEFLSVVQNFNDKYKDKMMRSILMQEIEGKVSGKKKENKL